MPRYVVILLMMFSCTLYSRAQSYLFVQLTSGDVMYYRLAERPTITYSDSEMIVTTASGLRNAFPVKAIRDIQYTPPTNMSIQYNDLNGLTMVYSVTGQYITTIEDARNISELNLPAGVYILRNDNASEKYLLQ